MSTLHFDKLSMHDRVAEPVTVGIPFPQGALHDPAAFGLRRDGAPQPCQTAVSATWEDGSVRWLLVHALVDLPGNAPCDLTFAWDGTIPRPEPATPVSACASGKSVELDTGPLCATLAGEGFDLVRQAVLAGQTVAEPGDFSGFRLTDADGRVFDTRDGTVDTIGLVDAGPVRAQVLVRGTHGGPAGSLLDYRATVTAWAGKPWIEVDYQFINREDGPVTLSSIGLAFRPRKASAGVNMDPRMALGEGHYRTSIRQGAGRRLLDQETILYQAVEHVVETFYGDFWADWTDGVQGLAITAYQAHQNFPKALAVSEEGIDVEILPADQPPLELLQGVAKTHRFLLHFHGEDTSLDEVCVRSLQFQYPDVAILPEAWHRESGVWDDLFPETRCRRLETQISDLGDRRGRGLGMLHWGDGPDHGYTNQGRGKGKLVWTNNEYDYPHAMFLYYARSGERRFRDCGLVAARHWMDVDFCHHSDDPLRQGGQPVHTAGHVTGGVTPSHEWTEGLLDYYHLTGQVEARDKAVAIADNILRHLDSPKFATAGGFAARETGWAMRGLVAVYLETRQPQYLAACDRIAGQFLEWKRDLGSFIAPYTSHTRVRVPFMTAIAVSALERYRQVKGDEAIGQLIVEEMDDLLTHCVMDDGRFFYKELPSLHRRLSSPREMEALAYAWENSGDRRFLEQVYLMMQVILERGLGGVAAGSRSKYIAEDAVVFDGPGPKSFAMTYPSLMVGYRVLAREGLLDELDYRRLPGADADRRVEE